MRGLLDIFQLKKEYFLKFFTLKLEQVLKKQPKYLKMGMQSNYTIKTFPYTYWRQLQMRQEFLFAEFQ